MSEVGFVLASEFLVVSHFCTANLISLPVNSPLLKTVFTLAYALVTALSPNFLHPTRSLVDEMQTWSSTPDPRHARHGQQAWSALLEGPKVTKSSHLPLSRAGPAHTNCGLSSLGGKGIELQQVVDRSA